MAWQPRGAGPGWGGGGGGSFMGLGVGFTDLGRKLALVLLGCFVAELLARNWFGAGSLVDQLSLWPVRSGRFGLWQIVTHPFFGTRDLLGFAFQMLGLYFFAAPAERYFGTTRFLTFLGLCIVASAVVGLLLAPVVAGLPANELPRYDGFGVPAIACFLVFCFLHRSATILLFFVVPMQAIYLAYFTVFAEAVAFLSRQPVSAYHLTGIALAWLTVERGVRIPDLRRTWLERKKRAIEQRLHRFEVIQGGKGEKDDGRDPNDPSQWVH